MKKKTLLIALATLPAYLSAQFDAELETRSGYEHNINLSPTTLEDDALSLDRKELIRSSAYQDLSARLDYNKAFKSSDLKLRLRPSTRSYMGQSDLDLQTLKAGAELKKEIASKTHWYNKASYVLKKRNGADLNANELGLPLGYSSLAVSSGLKFRWTKKNRSRFQVVLGQKTFDPSDVRQVDYTRKGLSYTHKYVLWHDHRLRSFGVKLSYQLRRYSLVYHDERPSLDRNWNFIDAEVFYKRQMSSTWFLEPDLRYRKRIDATDGRFGFSQYELGMNSIQKAKNFYLKISARYTKRDFTGLRVDDSVGREMDLLQYDFMRFELQFRYALSPRVSLTAQMRWISRESNNLDISSLAYRSYDSGYAGIGLRWQPTQKAGKGRYKLNLVP